jgi:hypothetical protein
MIESIYHKHKNRLGYRRITLVLRKSDLIIIHKTVLRQNGIKQIMSRKVNCQDNAVIEFFFGTLKS